MIPNVSKQMYQPPLPNIRHEGSFKGWRVSAKRGDNFYKIFVVVSAIFLLFAAVGVAAAATPPKPCVGDQCPSNRTCSVISSQRNVGAHVLSDYLWAGHVAPQVRHFEPDDPAVVAMQRHQARKDCIDKERSLELLYEEVEAIMDAAAKEENPEEKLKWVRRAFEELHIPSWGVEFTYMCYNPEQSNLCGTAADLWIKAAEAFLLLPTGPSHHYSTFLPSLKPIADRFYASSHCLRNAAYYRNFEHSEESGREVVSYLEKAILYQTRVDVRDLSPLDRAKLHEERANTYATLARKSGDKAHVEAVKNESLAACQVYAGLARNESNRFSETYALIKSGEQLYYAARYTPVLSEKKTLLTSAEHFLAKAWEEHPGECRFYEEFMGSSSKYNNFDLGNTLLGIVRYSLQQVETTLSIWERFMTWIQWKAPQPGCAST